MLSILVLFFVVGAFASDVLDLTGTTFDGATKGKDTHVKFYAPWCGHCKALAPAWEKYATAVKDSGVQVAKVDCTTQDSVCAQFAVQGYPTLIFLSKDGKAYEYSGGRDVDSLVAFSKDPTTGKVVERQAPPAPPAEVDDKDVVDLTGANFASTIKGKQAFVEFYAPWCGFCKKIAPVWAQLATDLKADGSDVIVARVDCTDKEHNAKICHEFEVRGFPTLYMVDKDNSAYKHQGDRDLAGFKAFVEDFSEGVKLRRPFVLNTGVEIIDNNWPMFQADVITLYKFKKLALAVVFGVGVTVGMLFCALFCGGSKSSGGKKKTD